MDVLPYPQMDYNPLQGAPGVAERMSTENKEFAAYQFLTTQLNGHDGTPFNLMEHCVFIGSCAFAPVLDDSAGVLNVVDVLTVPQVPTQAQIAMAERFPVLAVRHAGFNTMAPSRTSSQKFASFIKESWRLGQVISIDMPQSQIDYRVNKILTEFAIEVRALRLVAATDAIMANWTLGEAVNSVTDQRKRQMIPRIYGELNDIPARVHAGDMLRYLAIVNHARASYGANRANKIVCPQDLARLAATHATEQLKQDPGSGAQLQRKLDGRGEVVNFNKPGVFSLHGTQFAGYNNATTEPRGGEGNELVDANQVVNEFLRLDGTKAGGFVFNPQTGEMETPYSVTSNEEVMRAAFGEYEHPPTGSEQTGSAFTLGNIFFPAHYGASGPVSNDWVTRPWRVSAMVRWAFLCGGGRPYLEVGDANLGDFGKALGLSVYTPDSLKDVESVINEVNARIKKVSRDITPSKTTSSETMTENEVRAARFFTGDENYAKFVTWVRSEFTPTELVVPAENASTAVRAAYLGKFAAELLERYIADFAARARTAGSGSPDASSFAAFTGYTFNGDKWTKTDHQAFKNLGKTQQTAVASVLFNRTATGGGGDVEYPDGVLEGLMGIVAKLRGEEDTEFIDLNEYVTYDKYCKYKDASLVPGHEQLYKPGFELPDAETFPLVIPTIVRTTALRTRWSIAAHAAAVPRAMSMGVQEDTGVIRLSTDRFRDISGEVGNPVIGFVSDLAASETVSKNAAVQMQTMNKRVETLMVITRMFDVGAHCTNLEYVMASGSVSSPVKIDDFLENLRREKIFQRGRNNADLTVILTHPCNKSFEKDHFVSMCGRIPKTNADQPGYNDAMAHFEGGLKGPFAAFIRSLVARKGTFNVIYSRVDPVFSQPGSGDRPSSRTSELLHRYAHPTSMMSDMSTYAQDGTFIYRGWGMLARMTLEQLRAVA